jgi:hypothetical protein
MLNFSMLKVSSALTDYYITSTLCNVEKKVGIVDMRKVLLLFALFDPSEPAQKTTSVCYSPSSTATSRISRRATTFTRPRI